MNSNFQANNTARELQKRVEQLERINIDMKTRLEETTIALDQAQRDLRTRATEIQRLNHELEKTREQKDSLTRENKKLAGYHNLYMSKILLVIAFLTDVREGFSIKRISSRFKICILKLTYQIKITSNLTMN